jgi:uroporphyrinogen decarboxylase
MPDTGADLLSVDRIALQQAVEKAGSRVRVIGNFDTSEIWLGNPVEIERSAAAMTEHGRACPMGYVAATGCEVPLATPAENVHAFIRGCREAGINSNFGRCGTADSSGG